MKVEGIKMQCRCGKPECQGFRLTQLHLYANDNADIETLDFLLSLFDKPDAEKTETPFTLDLNAIAKARAEATTKATAARNN